MEYTIKVEHSTLESVSIYQWDKWKSPLLLVLLATAQAFSFGGKAMMINYIARFAPRDRPINTLIMIDQV